MKEVRILTCCVMSGSRYEFQSKVWFDTHFFIPEIATGDDSYSMGTLFYMDVEFIPTNVHFIALYLVKIYLEGSWKRILWSFPFSYLSYFHQ